MNIVRQDLLHRKPFLKILWSEVWKEGFQLMLIISLLGMDFDTVVVFVTNSSHLFRFAVAMLWHSNSLLSDVIFNLVPSSKKERNVWLSSTFLPWLKFDFIHIFIDGNKLKILSEIKPPLTLIASLGIKFCTFQCLIDRFYLHNALTNCFEQTLLCITLTLT